MVKGRKHRTPKVGVCVSSVGGGGTDRIARRKAMAERVRWVTKTEAARELGISLFNLDRKIRRGEIEVRREGPRV